MNYKKEKNKMIALLIAGAALAIGFFYVLYRLEWGYTLRASFFGVFVFAAITCYPLALVCAKGQIKDIFYSIYQGARQPFQAQHGNGTWQRLANFCIALATIVSFGWVYGVYYAYKRLQMMKSFR